MTRFTLIIIILFLLKVGVVTAQETITIKNKTMQGRQVNEEAWVFEDHQDTIIAVSFDVYNDLVKEIKKLKADTTRLSEIVKAKDELIKKFESYEVAANQHIEVQTKLIQTADSLYLGYKDLYGDLKKIYGINTLSVIPGIGVYNPPNGGESIVGSIGVEYNKIQGHFQLGRNYTGLLVGFRFPVF